MKTLAAVLALAVLAWLFWRSPACAWEWREDTLGKAGQPTYQTPQQRYNPYNHTWETTYQDRQLKHNPYDNSWSYQKPDAQPAYNPYEGKWEYPK